MSELRTIVNELAAEYNVDAKRLMAVVEVESAGTLFWSVGGNSVPPARPEAHYFHRLLTGAQRQQAVSQGLAHPKFGVINPPSSRAGVYGMIGRMEAIDRAAAWMSCSWGCGQVMGEHWRKLGYSSVDQMVAANYTARGQVDCMLRYIRVFGLKGALQQGGTTKASWAPFAKAYNGPAYAKWGYHAKMAAAYRKHAVGAEAAGGTGTTSTRDEYRMIQRDLKAIGYYDGSVDGIDGPQTRRAIREFQAANGLVQDGMYGSMTERLVKEAVAARKAGIEDRTLEVGGGLTGVGAVADKATDVGAVGEQVIDTVGPLQWLGGETMQMIVTGVMLLGVALVVYALVKRMKR